VKGTREAAAGLALAGCLLILISVGPESWPLVLGWLGASLATGLVWSRLAQTFASDLRSACCRYASFDLEGGLFFVPSAAALILASLLGHRSLPAEPGIGIGSLSALREKQKCR